MKLDNHTLALNPNFQTIAWGLLAILWGVTVLFDFLPGGIGIVGTGLILIGLNAARLLNGIPAKSGTTILGILALVWGGLELARPILRRLSEFTDWDWAIFAILLVALGTILLVRELLRIRRISVESLR